MGPHRGRLRIYLGAAPGVGKTFTMLDEGWRRRQRGTDVVVGYVETHGRARTEQQLRDLEIVPRRRVEHRGAVFEEMDVDAVIARRPQVALVDELAHTNIPGSPHTKRWQDIDDLLDAGIDVISTVNVQHLESLNDVVEEITGIAQRETVPDAFVRQADQIELVDMAPEALRRRMAHGNIYASDKIDAALGNYFRTGNLTALRELALLWVADQVEGSLHNYRARHGISQPWETRERVAVALTGAPGADDLIRRAARIARRSKAELIGIHVESPDGLVGADRAGLDAHRQLLIDLGGRYREVTDTDIGRALVSAAVAENATQLLIGASRRSRWTELVHGSVVNTINQQAGDNLDIHIIATRPAPDPDEEPRARRRARQQQSRVPRRRQNIGWVGLVIVLPLLTVILVSVRDRLGFASVGFCYLLAVVGIGAVGGVRVALPAAVTGFLLLDWFFADPIGTLTIANERDAVALAAFLIVASVVSFLVEGAARRAADASRARSEAETLAGMAGILLRDGDPLTDLLAQLVRTFSLDGASLLRQESRGWHTEAAAGEDPPTDPADADHSVALASGIHLALAGGQLTHQDRRVLDVFATQLTIALDSRRLRAEAAQSAALTKADDLRRTLLAAVSHDLRTPLTTIKTSATSLLDTGIDLDPGLQHELLATIDHEADRLNTLVGNLLDLGRLEADILTVTEQVVDIVDVVNSARTHLTTAARLVLDVPPDLPPVRADPILLERAIVNLAENALRYSPPDRPVTVRAMADDGKVDLGVVDHGPGIPRTQRARAFQPFRRLDGSPESAGVGLGLAVARGFVEAMNGEIVVDETPGGGTTMTISLQTAPRTNR